MQVAGKLLPFERQPRVCLYQPYLRLLWRMQTPLEHQIVETIHRFIQQFAYCSTNRRKDILYAWGIVTRVEFTGTSAQYNETYRCTRHWADLRPAVEWPWQKCWRLDGLGQGNQLDLWRKHSKDVPQETWSRPDLPRTPSRGRRLGILRKSSTCDPLQCAQLLWRIWQLWSHDECWLHAYVFV